MLRKWEYTAKALERLGAPAEIIEAAKAIDEALVKLGIDYNTHDWELYLHWGDPKPDPGTETWSTLERIVCRPDYCSACYDKTGKTIECDECKLSGGLIDEQSCTPESIYGEDLFKIVNKFVGAEALKLGKRKR